MGILPRVQLRDWDACDSSTHNTVFGWCDHPEVPVHASRAMVAAMVFRVPDLATSSRRLAAHTVLGARKAMV